MKNVKNMRTRDWLIVVGLTVILLTPAVGILAQRADADVGLIPVAGTKTLYGRSGRVVGYIDARGNVLDRQKTEIGQVGSFGVKNDSGTVIAKSPELVGFLFCE